MKYPKLEELLKSDTLKLVYPNIKDAYYQITEALEENPSYTSVLVQAPIGAGKRTLVSLLYLASIYRLCKYCEVNVTSIGLSFKLMSREFFLGSNYESSILDEFSGCLSFDASKFLRKFEDNIVQVSTARMVRKTMLGGSLTINTENDYKNYLNLVTRTKSRFWTDEDIPRPIVVAENWFARNIPCDIEYTLGYNPDRNFEPEHLELLNKDFKKHFKSIPGVSKAQNGGKLKLSQIAPL